MFRKMLSVGFMVLVVWVLLCPVGAVALPLMEIHFINVGQGDSIWIKEPEGKNVLIDTGNLSVGHKVRTYLQQNGVAALDALIITHTHPDHVGGIFGILPDIPVKKIYDNGADPGKEEVALEYLNFVEGLYLDRGVLRSEVGGHPGEPPSGTPSELFHGAGRGELVFGALRLQVLSPSTPLSGNLNADSIVLRVLYGDIRILLMADATRKVEQALVKQMGEDLRSQVLKVGHHGWADATSEAFLDCVKPKIAVISVGKGNRYGYPAAEVVKAIQDRGIRVLRTDEDGTIVVTTDGEALNVKTGR